MGAVLSGIAVQASPIEVRFDSDVFAFQQQGGISRYFVELVRRLSRYGVKAHLRVPISFNRHLRALPPGSFSGWALNSRWRNGWTRRLAAFASMLSDALTIRAGNFDLLHHTYYRRASGGGPYVTTVVDMIPELFPQYFVDWNPHKKKLERVRNAAVVLAISETTRRDLFRVVPDLVSPVLVTPLGVDAEMFGRLAAEVQECDYALYVGERTGHKNFRYFSEVMASILDRQPELRLVCLGGAPFSTSEVDPFRLAGVADRVLQRSVTDRELPSFYAGAKALVVPSHYEGFGLPILEAFASGCPVVASESGALPEVAGDAALYFDPGERDSMKSAIETMLGSRTLRREFRERGRQRAPTLSWNQTAAKTAEAYRTALRMGRDRG